MRTPRLTLLLAMLALFASCSFSRQFYAPDKLDSRIKLITLRDEKKGDTTLLHFEGANHIASFTDTRNNPKEFAYTIETIIIESQSGNKLYSWFFKPRHSPPSATILFLHGNGGNMLSQMAFVLPFVKKGYQVLLPDYSGFGFSEGRPTRKNVALDAEAALNMLSERPDLKGPPLLIYGQSMGGLIATRTAARHEAETDALVTEGAPSSHRDIAASFFPRVSFLARILVRERYTAVKSVRNYHKPILVIHSTEDKVAPFYMGEKIFANANTPKLFYPITHDHLYGPIYHIDSIDYKIAQLLKPSQHY